MLLSKVFLAMAVFAMLALSAAAQEENDIFKTSNATGMSPGVAYKDSGIRTAPASSMANVAGAWSLTLNDAVATRSLRLTLYQNKDAVFGSGDIIVSGNTTQVCAGGTLKGNSLSLFVIPSGEPSLYKIDIIVDAGSMTGSYVFSTQAAMQQGTASARLTGASMSIPVTKNEVVTIQVGAGQTNAEKIQGPKGSAV
jgi:hypothetical protein